MQDLVLTGIRDEERGRLRCSTSRKDRRHSDERTNPTVCYAGQVAVIDMPEEKIKSIDNALPCLCDVDSPVHCIY